MKKLKWIFPLILIFSLVFAACSTDQTENQTQTQAPGEGLTGEFEMSRESLLLMGTIALEGTDLAVDAEQAAVLLPLWKALQSLNTSDTAASAEIEAVYNQIEQAMTGEQITQIESMDLSMQTVNEILADLGFESGMGDRFSNLTDEQRAEMEAMREQSGIEPGQGAGRGGGFGGGMRSGSGEFSPPEGFTPPDGGFGNMQAESEDGEVVQGGGRMGANTALVSSVIQLLESKLQ